MLSRTGSAVPVAWVKATVVFLCCGVSGGYFCEYGRLLSGSQPDRFTVPEGFVGPEWCVQRCNSLEACAAFSFEIKTSQCTVLARNVSGTLSVSGAFGGDYASLSCIKDKESWLKYGNTTAASFERLKTTGMYCTVNYQVNGDVVGRLQDTDINACAVECMKTARCEAVADVDINACVMLNSMTRGQNYSTRPTTTTSYTCFKNATAYVDFGRVAEPTVTPLGPSPSLGGELLLVNIYLAQDQAQEACQDLGGALATFNTPTELKETAGKLLLLRTSYQQETGLWVGLEKVSETHWLWQNATEAKRAIEKSDPSWWSNFTGGFEWWPGECAELVGVLQPATRNAAIGLRARACGAAQPFLCWRNTTGPQMILPQPFPPSPSSNKAGISATPPSPVQQSRRSRTIIYAAVAGGVGLIVVLGALAYALWQQKKRIPKTLPYAQCDLNTSSIDDGSHEAAGKPLPDPGDGPLAVKGPQGTAPETTKVSQAKGQVPAANPPGPSLPQDTTTSHDVDNTWTVSAGEATTLSCTTTSSNTSACYLGLGMSKGMGVLIPGISLCLTVADRIIAAGEQVVANHERCDLLVSRIRTLRPLLTELELRVNRDPCLGSSLLPLFTPLQQTLEQCHSCVSRWCEVPGNSLAQMMRNMVRAQAYHQEFVFLCESLSARYNDLTLALNIRQMLGTPDILDTQEEQPQNLRAQLDSLEVRDLSALTSLMMDSDQGGWWALSKEERDLVHSYYKKNGLDLEQLLKQAARHHRSDLILDLCIPWSQIQIIKEVGEGGYGRVWYGRWQGHEVAVKKLVSNDVTARVQSQLKQEAMIMSRLHHPNIAKFYGLVLDPPHFALILQYYPCGCLTRMIHNEEENLSWGDKHRICLEVAQGMAYLHSRPVHQVVHGDLKSSNILIGEGGQMLISDFGLSYVKSVTRSTRPLAEGLSLVYSAPEILRVANLEKTRASDVYAYGMLMYEVLTRRYPFEGVNPGVISHLIMEGHRPQVPDEVPQYLREVMESCWQQDPETRPDFSDIQNHLGHPQ